MVLKAASLVKAWLMLGCPMGDAYAVGSRALLPRELDQCQPGWDRWTHL